MCAGTPMQPLEVAVKVALVVPWYLGDQDPLPTVPVVDERGMRHGPILTCSFDRTYKFNVS